MALRQAGELRISAFRLRSLGLVAAVASVDVPAGFGFSATAFAAAPNTTYAKTLRATIFEVRCGFGMPLLVISKLPSARIKV